MFWYQIHPYFKLIYLGKFPHTAHLVLSNMHTHRTLFLKEPSAPPLHTMCTPTQFVGLLRTTAQILWTLYYKIKQIETP